MPPCFFLALLHTGQKSLQNLAALIFHSISFITSFHPYFQDNLSSRKIIVHFPDCEKQGGNNGPDDKTGDAEQGDTS